MARRIFEIAKDLGIESKAIVAKCQAEGIPESVVKNHMSAVSVGLEATIREWFSEHAGQGGTATAIETSEKIDLDRVRTAKKALRRKDEKEGESGPATVTTAEAPASTEPATPAKTGRARAGHAGHAGHAPQTTHAGEEAGGETPEEFESHEADRHDEAAAPAATIAAPPPVMPAPPRVSVPARIEPPATEQVVDAGHAPAEKPALAAERIPAEAAPTAPKPAPMRGDAGPGAPAAATPPPPPRMKPVQAAPMNVPTRPTVVTPAGPKLGSLAKVKLAGPKVVRVEAPEVVEAPRPRRPSVGGPAGVSIGRGTRPGEGGGGDDDRGRSPRRKQGGPAPSQSQSQSAGTKRSSGQGVPDRRRGRSGTDWVGGAIFSEQDLIEREARLQRAGGFLKKRRQDQKRQDAQSRADGEDMDSGVVRIAAPFTIKDLSAATGVKAADIVKKLFLQGLMSKINDGIDPAKAQEIMIDFDIELEVVEARTAEEAVSAEFEKRDAVDLRPRGPVVTILGHVDHGKTSLLDKIRNANVAAGEAGGITQRTSAFRVPITVAGEKKEVVFLDTPGHEAFTSMRSRGANMTDVVVLVVSAPEGVMPQTIESISHAQAAKVPIVVALNKIDRPDATESQIQRTLGDLAKAGLNPVDWGGDTEVVKTSATTGQGITELLETLDYQAQLRDLKADFGGPARGTVIEARTEEGRGAVANLLVQDGKLKVGDFIVAGRAFGKIRDITDDRGQKIKEVIPPCPVQISGIDEVPDAGDRFFVVDSLKKAQEAAEQRRHREREAQLAQPKVTLDSLFTQMADKDVKEILIVLKAAEQGTVDVLKGEVEKIKTEEIKVKVLHGAVGGITEADVQLADASKAIIIGFNVIPSGKARSLAENKGVEIRTYQVIYDITDDIKKAAEGMLAPELRQEILGHAEVRKVFKVTKVGAIAGCYITDGTVQRDALIRVTRNGVVVENDRKLEQLKRFKDDAKDVRAGMECGMKIAGYDDIKEGDVLECYKNVEVKRTLAGSEKESKK
ncbi:MAG: translation initiation factor IF-2 [Phycisphaerales bacterium]|nr:translation initiation factor IF-2 [Phycisphaerales bacterium]